MFRPNHRGLACPIYLVLGAVVVLLLRRHVGGVAEGVETAR